MCFLCQKFLWIEAACPSSYTNSCWLSLDCCKLILLACMSVFVSHFVLLRSDDGWPGLVEEIQMELDRISFRNLGRDDRVISDHGREVRAPFLDEKVVHFLCSLPMPLKASYVAFSLYSCNKKIRLLDSYYYCTVFLIPLLWIILSIITFNVGYVPCVVLWYLAFSVIFLLIFIVAKHLFTYPRSAGEFTALPDPTAGFGAVKRK